ncbi:peptidoglycan-binding domain-containing protein [Edaphocola aurantiacus]|uniref:peptidoglycan-binding domain-containing protein n=1 Tax=Edaphocola aurantiacus TaxID=2601682 RepID=UPI001C93A176|nr:peptidoglycan-binding domain-containing protein [Edaphocola aurantiacus]
MTIISHIPVFGEHSQEVALIQTLLEENGFNPNGIDGIYGKDTKRAIIDFQDRNGLTKDGILGKITLGAMGLKIKTPVNADGYAVLSWEKHHPERTEWSKIVIDKISILWDKLAQCQDITDFHPDFVRLTAKQQKSVWAELICNICLHESSWQRTCSVPEKNFENLDSITNQFVRSEGLMQLSYQDKKSYASLPCDFNWEVDKNLKVDDPNKTIFNPKSNLEFGIEILANQIKNHKKIALSKGYGNYYWAVLIPDGKYTKIPQIKSILKGMSF